MNDAAKYERALASSISAHETWARTLDRPGRTAAARKALAEKFLAQADGDPIRAEHLRKAHYKRLALRAARARRLAKENAKIADDAEADIAVLGGADDE